MLSQPVLPHIHALTLFRHNLTTPLTLPFVSQYYPDRAVEREVQALQVWCEFKSLGCNWQGRLQLWEVSKRQGVMLALADGLDICFASM